MRKRKGRKGKKKKKAKDPGPSPEEIAQLESELQSSVAAVSEEIGGLKNNIEELKEENLKLQEETSTLKEGTEAYVSEMRARSERRQAILQGIQLLKQKQMTSLQQQRTDSKSNYQKRRVALLQDITKRTTELALAQKQLQDLDPVRKLQQEQNTKITYLETKLEEEKDVYDSQVLEMKRQLIRLKYSLQDELQHELDDVKEHASSVAKRCLGNYVVRVREENGMLRLQMKELIDENKLLEAEFQRQSHIRNEQLRERAYRSDIIRRLEQKLWQC
ncbi:cingulin-like protein 1 [Pollicipes pollicipes]|uniref:cingulin-like protein 1 n=1 Tax=Pollicipes pollicipes TaxID=41117 RepID=UPI001885237A|nr:cingulin-like protein 1 [Pollicipes pollicipes]